MDHGIAVPAGGLQISTGFPYPIMLLIGVTIVMSWMATRRRFGRYVFAFGGNPEAAKLGGINTRWTIMKMYILMGDPVRRGGGHRGGSPERSTHASARATNST